MTDYVHCQYCEKKLDIIKCGGCGLWHALLCRDCGVGYDVDWCPFPVCRCEHKKIDDAVGAASVGDVEGECTLPKQLPLFTPTTNRGVN